MNKPTGGFLGFVGAIVLVSGLVILWKGHTIEGLLTIILGFLILAFVALDLVLSDYIREQRKNMKTITDHLSRLESSRNDTGDG